MLGVVDPVTFARNIFLLVGALLFIGAATVVFALVWTTASACLSETRRQRAWMEYKKASHREDGQPYPPFMEGVCGWCGRGDTKIYHPDSGDQLCPSCYETFWRAREVTQGRTVTSAA